MSGYSASFLREVADHIRSCNYGSEKNNAHAAVEAARFDAMAVEQEDAERLAVDIGRAAIEASEGVNYGSDPDDFFRAAGEAVLHWLPLNGFHVISAKQLKDVQTAWESLRGYRNFDGHARSHVNQLTAAVEALFPATEPAEARCTFYAQTEHGDIQCELPDGHAAHHRIDPAPAEPAEEETKAEEFCCHPKCRFTDWGGVNRKHERGADCPIVPKPASSPVVPAPTETGPWETWAAVPNDVWFTSTSAVGSVPAHRKRGSLVDWQFRDGSVGVCDVSRSGNGKLKCRAPFVAAEEG